MNVHVSIASASEGRGPRPRRDLARGADRLSRHRHRPRAALRDQDGVAERDGCLRARRLRRAETWREPARSAGHRPSSERRDHRRNPQQFRLPGNAGADHRRGHLLQRSLERQLDDVPVRLRGERWRESSDRALRVMRAQPRRNRKLVHASAAGIPRPACNAQRRRRMGDRDADVGAGQLRIADRPLQASCGHASRSLCRHDGWPMAHEQAFPERHRQLRLGRLYPPGWRRERAREHHQGHGTMQPAPYGNASR